MDNLPRWTRFERAKNRIPDNMTFDAYVDALVQQSGFEDRALVERITRESLAGEAYRNSRYIVQVKRTGEQGETLPVVHLSIKRIDRGPVGEEHFRDFQRIKNELIGHECEAVELYPADSRLVDTANQYHLWVVVDPAFRFPFGFGERLVLDVAEGPARQRPLDED